MPREDGLVTVPGACQQAAGLTEWKVTTPGWETGTVLAYGEERDIKGLRCS